MNIALGLNIAPIHDEEGKHDTSDEEQGESLYEKIDNKGTEIISEVHKVGKVNVLEHEMTRKNISATIEEQKKTYEEIKRGNEEA